jgi:glutamate/tyrosine decarboxylase-like PLP-dependent enzyme
MLGDLLASALNPNVGGWTLSPAATEIERETVRWIAELIGYSAATGGLLVSGGNMANLGVLLRRARGHGAMEPARAGRGARRARATARLHVGGDPHLDPEGGRSLRAGNRRVALDPHRFPAAHGRGRLIRTIEADRAAGERPIMVVGTAGSVSTGAVDPLPALAAFCASSGSGSTSTAPTAGSRPRSRTAPRISGA